MFRLEFFKKIISDPVGFDDEKIKNIFSRDFGNGFKVGKKAFEAADLLHDRFTVAFGDAIIEGFVR